MDRISLLEDKLDHTRETLNFIAGELCKIKNYPFNRFTTLDKVIQWETDYHYRIGNILEIKLEEKIPRYYVKWERSTLCGAYKTNTESWTDGTHLFMNITELKDFLKNRIDKLVAY